MVERDATAPEPDAIDNGTDDDLVDDELVDDGLVDEDEAFEPDEALAAAGDPVERLADLVTYMASNLVDEPDAVEVTAERRGPGVHLSLRVPEGELGKVIGRQGRIARAMRTALIIAGSRDNLRASLDIEG
ncbi:MAG: KH domain-containing protein [Chloroflexota bacterium]|nr:KH domain-containing protein [Chloroflexota bacterium]